MRERKSKGFITYLILVFCLIISLMISISYVYLNSTNELLYKYTDEYYSRISLESALINYTSRSLHKNETYDLENEYKLGSVFFRFQDLGNNIYRVDGYNKNNVNLKYYIIFTPCRSYANQYDYIIHEEGFYYE